MKNYTIVKLHTPHWEVWELEKITSSKELLRENVPRLIAMVPPTSHEQGSAGQPLETGRFLPPGEVLPKRQRER